MWTKHISAEGKIYYYNAALSKSVWRLPADAATTSVIHEAVNLRPAPAMDSTSNRAELEAGEEAQPAPSFNIAYPVPPAAQALPSTSLETLSAAADDADKLLQAKIAQVLEQQRQAAKRSKGEGGTGDHNNATNAPGSEYLKQKNELEMLAGSKGEDGAKWYVR